MLGNVLLGLGVMAVCLALQLILIALALRYYTRRGHLLEDPAFGTSLKIICGVMVLLVIGNMLQIAIWALLFQALGEFAEFSEAFYHSAVNFATLGYGDIVMSDDHKLLGPLEAVNGVLMIGVSTAALMTVFQDVFRKTFGGRKAAD
jgi:voltage-gated potassium channel Kch